MRAPVPVEAEVPPRIASAVPVATPSAAPTTSAVAPTASVNAPTASATASTAPSVAPTAGPKPPPPPIVLQGVRRCTAEEEDREWCALGTKAGQCREGYCITPSQCGVYCNAIARRDSPCDQAPDPDCAKIPECVKDTKLVHDSCLAVRKSANDFCVSVFCEQLKQMPPPPR